MKAIQWTGDNLDAINDALPGDEVATSDQHWHTPDPLVVIKQDVNTHQETVTLVKQQGGYIDVLTIQVNAERPWLDRVHSRQDPKGEVVQVEVLGEPQMLPPKIVKAREGEWVVIDDDGVVSVKADSTFREQYPDYEG